MQLKFFLAASAASLSIACGLAAPAHAQETTSTIAGTVNSAGVPVSGANVRVVDTATGATATATTAPSGAFSVSGLRAGDSYTVSVTAPGYANAQVTDVVTVVAQTYQLPIELAAEGGQVIVVTASRLAGAGTVSQGPATVLNSAQIATVASVNRDVRDLSRRDPFARLDDTPTGGRAISFAGQNPHYNRFSVDGVPITDSFGLNTDGLPSRRSPVPFDAIGQFQAKVAPFDIREGNFQGGSINIVLRSGTNDFQGTGFFAYSSDELNGKDTKAGPGVPTGHVTLPNYEYKNYGVELSGPIIKDKVFFMIAGERLRASLPIPEGPSDNNAGTAIGNLTQSQVDQVSAIAKAKYNYDTGGVLNTNGDSDDRLVAKLDANLSDTQRLSLTYTYAKDSIDLGVNNFVSQPTGLSLASNDYISSNRLHTGVIQLNSEWSDGISTEFRGFYKDYLRGQDPVRGRGFAQFQVCTAPTSDRAATGGSSTSCPTVYASVYLGPDISRQTNALTVKTYGGLGQIRWKHGDNDIRAFIEYQDAKSFDDFVQRSAGDYYFDSLADFAAGNAQRLRYQNAVPSLDPTQAAASFEYQTYTLGFGDTWHASDAVTVDAGLRYDFYSGSSRPLLNPTFVNRIGFTNTKFINGLGTLQPRFGFTYKPIRSLTLRGGVGIFAGGTPDVYVANSFQNTGILTNLIDVQQTNNGGYTVGGVATTPAVGSAILSNVNGATVPAAANTLLTNATFSAAAPNTVNALAPGFELPSQWRATLSADWQPRILGGGWDFGADLLYSRVREQVFFSDARIHPNGLLTPDGRSRYVPVTTLANGTANYGDTNGDIILTNSNLGRSWIEVLRVRKDFRWGLNVGVSYTHQNVKDQNPATSSVALSNYQAGVALDPNGPAYGTSNDQVANAFKFDLTYDHAFFGDYKTTFALFGESRNGHPFSYTFRDPGSGRSSVFGTIGTSSRYLMYVPTGINDPLVSYSSGTIGQQTNAFIDSSGLAKYRGMIAPRNAFSSNWITKVDLHLSQEVPLGFAHSRFTLFADIENFTNLLNKNWGQIREYAFPYTATVATVTCLTQAVPTGTAVVNVGTTPAQIPAGGVALQAANAGQGCAQYRYDANSKDTAGNFVAPTDTIYSRQSLYTIRVGARISF